MRRLLLVGLALVASWARPVAAQAPDEIVWQSAPLAEALYVFSERSGLELVFALRLVEGTRVSGRYRRGDDPEEALRQLLRGSGVRAERIRAGQYVLIREPLNVAAGVEDGPEAFTGTLDGRVVDAETGVPLWGAHVWLVDVNLGDVVSESGDFAVPNLPTGEYAVRVSHVGYQPVRVTLSVFPESARLPPTIRLAPEPVASTTARVQAPLDDAGPAPGAVEITGRPTAVLPFALAEGDLAATLDWLPGLGRTGAGGGAVVVRGADPHRTLARRDGVPVYAPWHAFGLLSSLQPEALARVRLHRGAMPASLGGALAVLDTETTDPLGGDSTLAVGLGLLAGRALADVSLGDGAGLHVGLRRSTLGLALGPDERDENGLAVARPLTLARGAPSLGFTDVEAKASHRVGPYGQVALGGGLSEDRYARGGDAWTWSGRTLSARYRGLVSSRTALDARLYTSGHRATRPDADPASLAEVGAALDADRFVSLAHDVEVGASVARRTAGAARAHVEAVAYGLDTWALGEQWTLQPGLRVAAVAAGGAAHWALNPRLSVQRSSADERLRVRAGLARQTQTVQHLVPRYGGRYDDAVGTWALAYTDAAPGAPVPTLASWQLGAGVEWAPLDGLAFGVDAYGRRSAGLLEVAPGGLPGAPLRFEPHAERAAGLEAAARLGLGAWTVGLSGALARADVRAEGAPDLWRAARYDRRLSGGVLAERVAERTSLALRLDADSGAPRLDGRRAPASVRAGLAAGYTLDAFGARWTALAQVELRALGDEEPFLGPAVPDALATDLRGLRALPLVSVSATW